MIEADLVSTILPVYNRPRLLEEAVKSVLDQTYRPIEVIIVDDGSTDSTSEVAERMSRVHSQEVHVIHIVNGGPGKAREAGRQLARGEFIQYLDSDDLLLPGKFDVQVKSLRENPDCGVAYGYTRLIDHRGRIIKAPFKWTGKPFEKLFPALLVDRWWNTHTPLYRRTVCDQVGQWSDMRMGEDWEYDARVGALNVRLAHCEHYVSEHRHHAQERLTNNTPTQKIQKDTGRLLITLYRSAVQAGVEKTAPEMRHFARWVFSYARQCGAVSDLESAKYYFGLATQADGGASLDMKIYRFLTMLIGWTVTNKASSWFDHVRGRQAGHLTLSQSWMQ